MLKNLLLLSLLGTTLSGCCIISCNTRLPNSFLKVATPTQADCVYEDRAGARKFKAPGDVLAMPKNAPGTLTCTAPGYKPFISKITAQGWSPLTPLSGDPDALRYYIEISMAMEAEK